METSACRMLLALLFVTVTVTEAMNYLALPRMGKRDYLALPRMGRGGYMAFPRLGRGYIAFPRMGRSQGSDREAAEGDKEVSCCPTGLKTEWLLGDDGKTTTQTVCPAEACCSGLTEIMGQKPDGAFYSVCIPACS